MTALILTLVVNLCFIGMSLVNLFCVHHEDRIRKNRHGANGNDNIEL